MSSFKALEDRIKRECNDAGERMAHELVCSIGKKLGYNPNSTWWAPDEFREAFKPLRAFAAKRFAEVEFNRVWGEAEQAAIDVLKKGIAK